MPVSFKSDSAKGEKLEEDNFTTFAHAAAGHVSGSVVAKPCKQQEVEFYESSVNHLEFAAYMPLFIGTLSAAPQDATGLDAASVQNATTRQNPVAGQTAVTTATSSSTDTPLPPELGQETGQIALPQALAAPDNAWVPSGGRKLDTGISIVLENVASGFKRPNVIDVKLGSRLWADDAVPDKRAKLDKVSRETTSGSLGFRVAGMKVWAGEEEIKKRAEEALDRGDKSTGNSESSKVNIVETDGYRRYDKWYGRSFGHHNIKEAFETFFAGAKSGSTDHSKLVATRLATQLRHIQSMLEAEESRMYSASVLYVYEGDAEAFDHALEEEAKEKVVPETEETGSVEINAHGEGELDLGGELELGAEATTLEEIEEDEDEPPKVDDIRLIDFAHASWTPGQGPDENALHGIKNLARIMEELAGTNL